MVDEVAALAAELPPGTFLDATVGGAGHAVAVLGANRGLDLIGLDRDPLAIRVATERLGPFPGRVRIEQLRFDQLDSLDPDLSLSGFLFDLGVSSPQLDRAERGFSFRHDGPLDMRMDPSSPLTADEVVNQYEADELSSILRRFADERFASRIAKAIVAARPITGTTELAAVVVAAIPAAARRTGGHPAKRTFQAIRIEVNGELSILAPALERAVDALSTGGRGLVLTYHSGEDRIVKTLFRDLTSVDQPPGLPVEVEPPPFTIVRPQARRPSQAEMDENPRAASARLRVIERVAA